MTWMDGAIADQVWQRSLNQVQPHQHGLHGHDPDTRLGTVSCLSTDPGQPCLRLQNTKVTSFTAVEVQLIEGDNQVEV